MACSICFNFHNWFENSRRPTLRVINGFSVVWCLHNNAPIIIYLDLQFLALFTRLKRPFIVNVVHNCPLYFQESQWVCAIFDLIWWFNTTLWVQLYSSAEWYINKETPTPLRVKSLFLQRTPFLSHWCLASSVLLLLPLQTANNKTHRREQWCLNFLSCDSHWNQAIVDGWRSRGRRSISGSDWAFTKTLSLCPAQAKWVFNEKKSWMRTSAHVRGISLRYLWNYLEFNDRCIWPAVNLLSDLHWTCCVFCLHLKWIVGSLPFSYPSDLM